MSDAIHEPARARLITDGPDPRPVPVVLGYDPGAPRTVRIRFPGGIEWAVDRDALEGGLRSPVTSGDIRVWPCGRVQLIVELHSPEGVAVLQFDSAPVIRFLRRTHEEAGADGGTRPAPGPSAVRA
ncbi:SsgA family sporulation/cell division regulator [Streptomyces nitrosporeus]|uniref:SsgA family sporulation/cell division regulator n=1 Tax=Streptomyces nitrosporeus TaxID=28894 RepID=A0A5J6FD19_9ACTN|nr:SsgA family sporulation/cell division regulator [Streptomyces nitrosporeus]QEU74021.1 SsgA family sporulation/cell division regulator [Streptomyces nitrosporeus]GGZ00444.1 cell division protein [Streptomyces nitrosporeus]